MRRLLHFTPFVMVLALPLQGQDRDHLGKSLSAWQAGLESPAEFDRLLAIRSIGEMAIANRDGTVPALAEALGHPDSSVRYWAAVAAAQLEDPSLIGTGALQAALADDVPEVRIQAALALIRDGAPEQGLAVLEKSLGHRNRGVRLHAAHAADAIGDRAKPLAPALRKALDDDFDYVRRVARHALWTLGERACPYQDCDPESQP